MKTAKRSLGALLAILALAASSEALAQVQPATPPTAIAPAARPTGAAPASAPASAPARRTLKTPPGFTTVTVTGRTVLCEPADEDWVRSSLLILQPASRPSTSPADLFTRLTAQRENLITQITSDLALPDRKDTEKFFDEQVMVRAKRFRDVRVPMFFLATTVERLRQLIEAGWGGDYFAYNKQTDEITIRTGVNIGEDGALTDDAVLPILFGPTDSPDARTKMLGEQIRAAERNLLTEIAGRANLYLQQAFWQYVAEKTAVPLKLKLDQEWFAFGVAATLSNKYVSQISGAPVEEGIIRLVAETADAPVKSVTVDAIHPTDPEKLRPEYLSLYIDAVRRKGTWAVYNWSKTSGPTAIPKVLTVLRQTPPPDAAAILKAIKDTTGADLAAQLGAR